jgi:hypothetical protein
MSPVHVLGSMGDEPKKKRGTKSGHAYERQYAAILREQGWFVMRSPASKGVCDLIAIRPQLRPTDNRLLRGPVRGGQEHHARTVRRVPPEGPRRTHQRRCRERCDPGAGVEASPGRVADVPRVGVAGDEGGGVSDGDRTYAVPLPPPADREWTDYAR